MTEDELNDLKQSVFAAYEGQGFSQELVGEWAISENDVADFLEAAGTAAPKRVLEVGTYVGVSTMMLALHCPNAEIFTVDPDFPLAKEMLAVGSKSEIGTGAATHHSIARAAAESLGVLDRIHFFKGGFSVGDTFASSLGDAEARVDVVGPGLCKEHGPFDFAFIDGLHTSDAVLKDIELCAANMMPGAPIVLHDCIGFWGASVRRGVFEFLCRNPEFTFFHPPYKDVYRSIGVIKEQNNVEIDSRAPETPSLALKSIIDSVSDRVFGRKDYAELVIENPFTNASQQTLDSLDSANIIAIEAADFLNDDELQTFFKAISESNGVALLGATPLGEQSVAGPQSRPLARLMEIAENAGATLFAAAEAVSQ
ncbi:MAG: class I SAM-dependent methyltransferase [Pseudomonadota bacterium]